MIIHTIPVTGAITTNAYFYIDEATKTGFLIDPGSQADKLLQMIDDNNWHIEKILLTHGHFDHIGAVNELQKQLKLPCYAHYNGKDYLPIPEYNLSAYFEPEIIITDYLTLKENDIIVLSTATQNKLQVIHTPGHTQDSVVYYDADNHLAFVGDTIFKNSYGRTDVPGGNEAQLLHNITHKILTLPDDTVLYSGHTQPTTVKAEKQYFGI